MAGYLGSVPLMLLFTVLTSFGEGPWQGDMSAVIAQCSEHTYLKSGKRIDGSMFSCTSLGVKLGGGIGVALSGWLLDISGYINLDNAVQPDSCINMMYFMYLWLPFIFARSTLRNERMTAITMSNINGSHRYIKYIILIQLSG